METLASPVVRWLTRRDLPRVLQIERASYRRDFTWGEEDFRSTLQKGSVIGKVAEVHPEGGEPQVVGFCVYEHVGGPKERVIRDEGSLDSKALLDHAKRQRDPRRIDLLNLAVCPLWRLRGVGRALVAKLKRRVKPRVRATVHEANLDAQLFFRALGFRAIQVLRGHYDYDQGDGYVMEYRRQ